MKNKKGQSTIEFIITFSATVGFIFLFIKFALNYTNGYMVHHAVYLASRAYMVQDSQVGRTENELVIQDAAAKNPATLVYKKYLPTNLVKDADSAVLKFNEPESPLNRIFIGVWVEFEQKFSLGFIGGKDKIKFRSESFLGKEPTRLEGYVQTCTAIKDTIAQGDCKYHVTLDDNGG